MMYGSSRKCALTLIGSSRPKSGMVMPMPTTGPRSCAGSGAGSGAASAASRESAASGLVVIAPFQYRVDLPQGADDSYAQHQPRNGQHQHETEQAERRGDQRVQRLLVGGGERDARGRGVAVAMRPQGHRRERPVVHRNGELAARGLHGGVADETARRPQRLAAARDAQVEG